MRTRDTFTDRDGREWRPDPTGRFTYRHLDGGRWTELVRMTPSQEPGSDPEGAAALAVGTDPVGPPPGTVDAPAPDPAAALPTAALRRWEHHVEVAPMDDLTAWLDERGTLGWELVALLSADGDTRTAVFKRPLG